MRGSNFPSKRLCRNVADPPLVNPSEREGSKVSRCARNDTRDYGIFAYCETVRVGWVEAPCADTHRADELMGIAEPVASKVGRLNPSYCLIGFQRLILRRTSCLS